MTRPTFPNPTIYSIPPPLTRGDQGGDESGLSSFPRPIAEPFSAAPKTSLFRGALIIGILAGLLLFARLDYPLLEPDEGRFAEIPLLMLKNDQFAVPVLRGRTYNHKPPFAYWLVAGSYTVFGVHDWAVRIVPALATWLTIMVAYLWGSRVFGVRTGILGALLLLTMAGFAPMGRMMLVDSVLTFCMTAAWWTGHAALSGPRMRWGWWLASAAACGIAVMAKGPVGLVLVGPALFAYRWLDRGSLRWKARHWLAYGVMALAIASPWYAWMIKQNPHWAEEFFWRHNVSRFANRSFEHHQEPWWFYGPVLLGELLPWSPLLVFLATELIRRRHDWRRLVPGPLRFVLFAAGWPLLFYSAAACKLPTYLMPILPPMAFVIGHYLNRLLFESTPGASVSWLARLPLRNGPLITCLVLLVVVAGAAGWLLHEQIGGAVNWVFLAAVPVGLIVLIRFWRRLSPRGAWACCFLTSYAVLGFALWNAVPAWANWWSAGIPARDLIAEVDRTQVQVVAYGDSWDAASFYLGGDEVPVYAWFNEGDFVKALRKRPQTLVLILESRGRMEELERALPPDVTIERTVKKGRVTAVYVQHHRGAASRR